MKKNIRLISPAGSSLWAMVLRPDTKFNPEGVFSIQVVIPQEHCGQMLQAIEQETQAKFQEIAEELKARGKHADVKKIKLADKCYTEVFDETGEPTGELKFKFKLNASGKNKAGEVFHQKPVIVDAKGRPCDVEIWNGSTVKVSFEIIPFYTTLIGVGVSLRLKAVQVIKLVSGEKDTGDAFGFGVEEGFEAHEAPAVQHKAPEEPVQVVPQEQPKSAVKGSFKGLQESSTATMIADFDDLDELFAE